MISLLATLLLRFTARVWLRRLRATGQPIPTLLKVSLLIEGVVLVLFVVVLGRAVLDG